VPKSTSAKWRLIGHCSLAAAVVLIVASTIYLSLAYSPPAGAEPPNVADWMQGWGSLLAVLFGALAVIAAAAVYRQAKEDARTSDERWRLERTEAAEASREAEQRWREDREAMDHRWHEELAELRRSANAAEEQAVIRREEHLEALFAVPRSIRAVRVAVGHGQRFSGHSLGREVFVNVHNLGTNPIIQVHALITFKPDSLSFGASCPVINPGENAVLRWKATRGESEWAVFSIPDPPIWDFETTDPSPFWSVALHFTDSAERTWRRVDNGTPVQVPAGQLP
jgi:hypothetical protein